MGPLQLPVLLRLFVDLNDLVCFGHLYRFLFGFQKYFGYLRVTHNRDEIWRKIWGKIRGKIFEKIFEKYTKNIRKRLISSMSSQYMSYTQEMFDL